jgi:hypothetical protein
MTSENNPRDTSPRWTSTLAQFSSVLALSVSFLALAIGAYQTRLMQNQARASVWPFLAIGYLYNDAGANAGFTWQIENNGVGPARIESVTVTLDGQPIRHWNEVLKKVLPPGEAFVSINGVNGNVLPPNTNRETTIEAIKITKPEQAKIFYEARDRLKMDICYCSVYDECWTAHWQQHKVQAVERCEVGKGGVEFEE